jgi:hypothetical protein
VKNKNVHLLGTKVIVETGLRFKMPEMLRRMLLKAMETPMSIKVPK